MANDPAAKQEAAVVAACVHLGMVPPFTLDQARARFRQLSKIFHPDVTRTGDTEAFKRMSDAIDTMERFAPYLGSLNLAPAPAGGHGAGAAVAAGELPALRQAYQQVYTAAQAAEAANRSLLEELAATRAKAVAAERAALMARTKSSATIDRSGPRSTGWMVPWWTVGVAAIISFSISTTIYFTTWREPPSEYDLVLESAGVSMDRARFMQLDSGVAATPADYDDAYSGNPKAVIAATLAVAPGVKVRRKFDKIHISTGTLEMISATVPAPPKALEVVIDTETTQAVETAAAIQIVHLDGKGGEVTVAWPELVFGAPLLELKFDAPSVHLEWSAKLKRFILAKPPPLRLERLFVGGNKAAKR